MKFKWKQYTVMFAIMLDFMFRLHIFCVRFCCCCCCGQPYRRCVYFRVDARVHDANGGQVNGATAFMHWLSADAVWGLIANLQCNWNFFSLDVEVCIQPILCQICIYTDMCTRCVICEFIIWAMSMGNHLISISMYEKRTHAMCFIRCTYIRYTFLYDLQFNILYMFIYILCIVYKI